MPGNFGGNLTPFDFSGLAKLGQMFRGTEHQPKWKPDGSGGFYDENSATAPKPVEGPVGKPMTQYERSRVERADRQDAAKTDAATRQNENFSRNASELSDYALGLSKHPGLDAATGSYKSGNPTFDKTIGAYIPAEMVPNKPGSNAANFEAAKKTLKAKIGFTELAAMRNASKTGGALGQVAVQEIDFLQSSVEALDGIQDPKVLRQAMVDISKHYRKLSNIMKVMKSEAPASDPGAGSEEQDFGDPQDGDEVTGPDGQVYTWPNVPGVGEQ